MKKLQYFMITLLVSCLAHGSAKFNAGGLNIDFGTNGIFYTLFSDTTDGQLSSIVIDNQQRIICSGYVSTNTTSKGLIFRLLSNSQFDHDFNDSGYMLTSIYPDENNSVAIVQIDLQQRLITLNNRIDDLSSFTLAAYLQNGSLDTTFGADGIVSTVTTFTSGTLNMYGLLIDSGNNIVCVGTYVPAAGTSSYIVLRYTQEGVLDTTFGGGLGYIKGTFQSGKSSNAYGSLIDVQGRILVAGVANNEISITRLLSTGSVDTTFATDGIFTSTIANNGYLIGLALDDQQRIIAGGAFDQNVSTRFGVIRLTADGVLDTSFGSSGIALYPYLSQTPYDANYLNSLGLDPFSRIIMMGVATGYTPNLFLVARALKDGALDTSFGANGFASTNINNSSGNVGVLDNSGRILVAGSITDADLNNNAAIAAFSVGYDLVYYNAQFAGQSVGLL